MNNHVTRSSLASVEGSSSNSSYWRKEAFARRGRVSGDAPLVVAAYLGGWLTIECALVQRRRYRPAARSHRVSGRRFEP
jgi:hypothetical protein